MTIPFPPYRPTSFELRLPGYPVITNNWRATEWPEILGNIAEGASLRLSYRNITDAEALELLLLWRATAGGRYPLNPLPAEVAAGINDAALADRILNIAPLVWVPAGPPSQESVKRIRSGLEIELVSELRFSPVIALPTATCPAWAFRSGPDPEAVAPCISVIDETTVGGANPSQEVIDADWNAFRFAWPLRPFRLLIPYAESFPPNPLPPGYGPGTAVTLPTGYDGTSTIVNRDEGNPSLASDWFALTGAGSLPPGQPVFLFVDISGSMTEATVAASISLFEARCANASIPILRVARPDERYIEPFISALVPT